MCGTRIARLIQNKVSEDGNGARQFAPPYGAEQEQCKTKSWRTGEDSFLQHCLIVISKLSLYSEAYEYQIWLFITRLASLPPRFYFTTKLCLLNLEAYPCLNNKKKKKLEPYVLMHNQTWMFYSKDKFKQATQRKGEPHHKSPLTVTYKWNLSNMRSPKKRSKKGPPQEKEKVQNSKESAIPVSAILLAVPFQ